MEKDNKQDMKKIVSNNAFLFQICFHAAPLYLIMYILEGIKHATLIFFEHTYGIKYVLETIEFGRPYMDAIRFLALIMVVLAISQVYSGILINYIEFRSKPRIIQALRMKLFEKSKDLDLACYDNPKFYNEFVLSVAESEKCVERLLKIIADVTRGITMVVVCGSYFLLIDEVSVIFVLASFLLTVFFGKIMNKFTYSARLEKNPIERKRAYIHRVFYLNDYAKELRMNPEIKEKLYEDFEESNQELYKAEKKYTKKCWALGFVRRYLANDFVGSSLYIIYLVYKAAILHSISYSSVVVLFNSSGNIKGSLNNLAESITSAAENSLYIENIRSFLAYKTKISSRKNMAVPTEPAILELKDVSFSYNNHSNEILHNINMRIHPYEKIALVGYNGAGKTTLVKLFMRLYDVTKGEVLLNGINIKDYDINEYRKQLGVVFQDYQIFAASVKDNVLLEDLHDENLNVDHACIQALTDAGFKDRLLSFEKGLQTPLTSEFEEDGINLSGGESQKVAIARVLYKDANRIILDEPSSALDPIAEYNLNKTMQEAANHRTVIFISHRLSTTRDADRIYMMEKGSIIEEGKHEELLKMNGKYSMMWKAQAERYKV